MLLLLWVSVVDSALVDSVDTTIGTGGFGWGVGGQNPGAQLPFGTLRLGPDTSLGPVDHVKVGTNYGGYWYNDTSIRAFSHTHLVGAGVDDFGNIGVMAVGALSDFTIATNPLTGSPASNYRSAFDHADESAKPGAYAVQLLGPGVHAQLAALGSHAGIHRYSFDAPRPTGSERAFVVVDFCHTASADNRDACASANVRVEGLAGGSAGAGVEVSGEMRNHGSLSGRSDRGGVDVFFVATVTAVPCGGGAVGGGIAAAGVWQDGQLGAPSPLPLAQPLAAASVNGSAGAYIEFGGCAAVAPTAFAVAELRVAISFLGVAQARENLAVQGGAASFEAGAAAAAAAWEAQLGVVAIAANNTGLMDEDLLAQFRSAQYRAAMAPTQFSEPTSATPAEETYLGFDHAPHTWAVGARVATDGAASHYYTDMSLWDVHRTQLPLLLLTQPAVGADVARSLVRMARDGGRLPRWPLADVYTGCMIGAHGVNVLADGCVKGALAGDADAETVFRDALAAALSATAAAARVDGANYTSRSFVTFEADARAASLTLSYAFDDWSVAQLATCVAARFGDDANNTVASIAKAYAARSVAAYGSQWVAARQLMCPRLSAGPSLLHPTGHHCPLPELEAVPYFLQRDVQYVEGDAWQWLWFVPSDPEGLVALFPSRAAFAAKLDAFFANATGWALPNSIPNPYYWAGNEPDLLAVWLFPFAGRADLTQRWSRWLLLHKYSSRADGVPGNDDFGTMSAWYIFAVLGFYPLPGSTRYVLGGPLFSDVRLQGLGGGGAAAGADLRIVAHGAGRANPYVANCTLDGQVLAAPFVEHADLVAGRTLEFWMSPQPTHFWRDNDDQGA